MRVKGMKGSMTLGAALLLAMMMSPAVVAADPLSNLPFNLAGGTPNLDVRLRYENVKMDEPLAAPMTRDEANAFTARARLGYTTGKWNDLDGQLEYEGLTVIGEDQFNSFTNRETQFPVVADAKVNEVNQAWVRYAGLPKTAIKYGRQRILLDNQRFIGNVGWRGTEMTYDATLMTSTLLPKTTFTYAYLTNVNSFRFFDYDPSAALDLSDNVDLRGHLVNAQFAPMEKKLVLTAYGYFLDFDEIPAGAPLGRLFQDTQTVGLRLTGAVPVDKLTFSYALEYADLKDYADAPQTVEGDYTLVEAGLGYGKLKGTLGYEVLSGDGTYGFQAPLATAHAFQGWADQFLITPVTGLVRTYLSLGTTLGKTSMTAVYHDFTSDQGSTNYGTELGLLVSYPLIESFVLSAKYASYDADEFPLVAGQPIDTQKTWLYAEYKF